MKELNIYDVRNDFLEQKGFLQAWGSPVEVFVKLLESIKIKDKKIKDETAKIEKAFDNALAAIMNEPENFNPERIKFFIEENMPKSGVLDDVMKSQPARPQQAPAPAISKSLNQNPSKKKQEEEDLQMALRLSKQ